MPHAVPLFISCIIWLFVVPIAFFWSIFLRHIYRWIPNCVPRWHDWMICSCENHQLLFSFCIVRFFILTFFNSILLSLSLCPSFSDLSYAFNFSSRFSLLTPRVSVPYGWASRPLFPYLYHLLMLFSRSPVAPIHLLGFYHT